MYTDGLHLLIILDDRVVVGCRWRVVCGRKWSIGAHQNALEGLAEFQIENGVDDGVDERVDVAEPRRQVEGDDSRLAIAFEFRANRVQYITGEERYPTDEEDTYHELKKKVY